MKSRVKIWSFARASDIELDHVVNLDAADPYLQVGVAEPD
jgi:hypothetical protein